MLASKPKPMSPTARRVVPWNEGAFVGPKPPFKPKQVWAIRLTLRREGRIRDLAPLDLAIDSKLRVCDLVQLRIDRLVTNAAARHRATIVRQKTGKPVQFDLTEHQQGIRELNFFVHQTPLDASKVVTGMAGGFSDSGVKDRAQR